jgi:hypothetical protein
MLLMRSIRIGARMALFSGGRSSHRLKASLTQRRAIPTYFDG